MGMVTDMGIVTVMGMDILKKIDNNICDTVKEKSGKRDDLQQVLHKHGIPSMIYYHLPLYKQEAFKKYFNGSALVNTEQLCNEGLSLPMHTELEEGSIEFICEVIKNNL